MRGLVILFVGLAVSAPVIAAANAPDTTWIGGLYDGGDGDEVLTLVWDQSPALAFEVVGVAEPSAAPACPLPQNSSPSGERALKRSSRAPPLA